MTDNDAGTTALETNAYRCTTCSGDVPDFVDWGAMTEHAVDAHDGSARFSLLPDGGATD